MSRQTDETNADRVRAIQKLWPPAKDVRSPNDYASLDELARLLGTTRPLIQTWIRSERPAEPSAKHRAALARLSKGRYKPADFRTDRGRERAGGAAVPSRAVLAAGLEELADQVERLGRAVTLLAEAQRPALRNQLRRVLAGEPE